MFLSLILLLSSCRPACTVDENRDGTYTMTCPDGTVADLAAADHTHYGYGDTYSYSSYDSGYGYDGGSTSYLIVDVDWIDDGLDPTDSDADGVVDTNCGDQVHISVSDPLGEPQWDFGIAETGAVNGWFGEDCLAGDGETAICHRIGVAHTLDEVTDCRVDSLLAGSRTLLDASKEPFLTYYLADTLGYCFVWGHDASYYDALGCTEIF